MTKVEKNSVEHYMEELRRAYKRSKNTASTAPAKIVAVKKDSAPLKPNNTSNHLPLNYAKEAEDLPSNGTESSVGFFQAQVFTGNQAFPVHEARVMLTRNGEIECFLLTDESGQTQVIETHAPPRENSLEPYSSNKSMDYRANVFAEGYVPLNDLLVSQVGSAFSLLNAELVPESEAT